MKYYALENVRNASSNLFSVSIIALASSDENSRSLKIEKLDYDF